MSSSPSPCKETLAAISRRHGIEHFGVAEAGPVDAEAVARYRRWLAEGRHAGMAYMERYDDLRDDPRLLLPSARSIISCAIGYYHPASQPVESPRIAMYARGDDYHEVVRERLSAMADEIRGRWGGETRVCVDTAPIRERYWAMRAGVGFIGRNNHLIIPGYGSYFFLGEILTTVRFAPDKPLDIGCGNCRRCLDACPGGALTADGALDARQCLSYLTIEHRGPLPAGTRLGNHLYGCDECQLACPHNRNAAATTEGRFHPRAAVMNLSREEVAAMTQERFSALFRHSAVKRAKLAGLLRNLSHLDPAE